MAQSNPKYHQLDTAEAYQEKIATKRRLSGWLEARMLRRSLADVQGERILDCPCGTGRIDEILRSRFSDITGVDGAAPMLEVYMREHPERKGEVSDVFALPFEDDHFDWTVCHRLFHHFGTDEDRINLLKSLARVSRHGITLYCWLDVPFSRRGKGRSTGRQSISARHLDELIAKTPLVKGSVDYAAWPFSPKAIVTLRKSQ